MKHAKKKIFPHEAAFAHLASKGLFQFYRNSAETLTDCHLEASAWVVSVSEYIYRDVMGVSLTVITQRP